MTAGILPISLNVSEANILVIGGGKLATRKIRCLLNFTNNINIIGADINEHIKSIGVKYILKKISVKDLQNRDIVYTCTDNISLNKSIAGYCNKNNILVNATGALSSSDFYSPAMLINNNITIAVSSTNQNYRKTIEVRNLISQMISKSNERQAQKNIKRKFLPITFNLFDKKVLIIGSGKATVKKQELLSQHINYIDVFTNTDLFYSRLKAACAGYDTNLLRNYTLVYDCSNNDKITELLISYCQRNRILLNVHDQPEKCNFISPAIYKAKDYLIAICSDAKNVRKSIYLRNMIKFELDNA